MSEFSPREIVSELDRFVVGHSEAKRAVAVALRNRWRRQRLPADLADDVLVEFGDDLARGKVVAHQALRASR